MPGLKLVIDVQSIAAQLKEYALEVEQDLNKAAADLAILTKEKVNELASTELKTTADNFNKNVGTEEVSPGIWVVFINEEVLWQEEDGIVAGTDMKKALLSGEDPKHQIKTSKDGHKYRSIPFDHGKNTAAKASPKAAELVGQIKAFLKANNVPYKKIEKNSDGSNRLGKLHQFDIPSDPPTDRASTSALKGLSIFQTKTESGGVRRDIMTFRTVSNGPASADKWIHPGYQPKKFLDRAAEWAEKEWSDKILPEIMAKWK